MLNPSGGAGCRVLASNPRMMNGTFTITKITGTPPGMVTSGGHTKPSANGYYVVATTGSTEQERPTGRPHLRLVKEQAV
jgi:hypothetical protein